MTLKGGILSRLRSQFARPRGFWGRLAGLIMARRPSNRERNRWTVSLLNLRPTDRVLEIGFGPGLAIADVAGVVSEGLAAGVDHSELMLQAARRTNAEGIAAGHVDLRLAGAEAIPDFGGAFDKIFAVNVMMFWDGPVSVLKELRLVLKPGGLIAMTHQPRLAGADDARARRAGEKIAEQLTAAGFEQVRIETRAMKPVAAVCVLAVNPKS